MSKAKTKSQKSKVYSKKIVEFSEINQLSETLKRSKNSVVLVGGCFDILHIGHVRFLEAAKKYGVILVVALESDEKTKLLKGKDRPINSQGIRAGMLAALETVDYILKLPAGFKDEDYFELTKKISPQALAVAEENFKIKNIAENLGIKYIKVLDKVSDISTSKLARILGIE